MRDILKYVMDRIYYPALLLLSADRILRLLTKKRRLIIMYHGVSERRQFHVNGRHVLASQFEKHLRYFKKNFNVVSLHEICRMKINSINPDRCTIALTFDDGFLNNLDVALPLLEKYELPATFFTCSINLEDRNYIHPADYLDLIRVAENNSRIKIGDEIFERDKYAFVHTVDGITAVQHLNSLSFEDYTTALLNLSSAYKKEDLVKDIDDEAYKLLSAENVEELSLNPFASIGSHCHSHISLTQLEIDEMKKQLVRPKHKLEKLIGEPVNAIAFPYGDYDRRVIELSRETGYHYLIAGGHVEREFSEEVFPRIGILGAASYARNILSINSGFARFGF